MGRKISRINSISVTANTVINILFVAIILSCVLPLLLVIAVSLTPENILSLDGYKLIPRQLSLYAYQYVMADWAKVLRGYGISIFVTVSGSILSVLITAMLAFPLSRKTFRYRNLFTFIIFFTMLFNGGLVPFYLVYTQLLHLKNTLLVLIIPR